MRPSTVSAITSRNERSGACAARAGAGARPPAALIDATGVPCGSERGAPARGSPPGCRPEAGPVGALRAARSRAASSAASAALPPCARRTIAATWRSTGRAASSSAPVPDPPARASSSATTLMSVNCGRYVWASNARPLACAAGATAGSEGRRRSSRRAARRRAAGRVRFAAGGAPAAAVWAWKASVAGGSQSWAAPRPSPLATAAAPPPAASRSRVPDLPGLRCGPPVHRTPSVVRAARLIEAEKALSRCLWRWRALPGQVLVRGAQGSWVPGSAERWRSCSARRFPHGAQCSNPASPPVHSELISATAPRAAPR